MSSQNDPLTECWMVNDTSSSDNNFIVSVMYLVLRLETPRILCLSTSFFNTGFISLEVMDLVQTIIENNNQPYKGNWVSIENLPLSIS